MGVGSIRGMPKDGGKWDLDSERGVSAMSKLLHQAW